MINRGGEIVRTKDGAIADSIGWVAEEPTLLKEPIYLGENGVNVGEALQQVFKDAGSEAPLDMEDIWKARSNFGKPLTKVTVGEPKKADLIWQEGPTPEPLVELPHVIQESTVIPLVPNVRDWQIAPKKTQKVFMERAYAVSTASTTDYRYAIGQLINTTSFPSYGYVKLRTEVDVEVSPGDRITEEDMTAIGIKIDDSIHRSLDNGILLHQASDTTITAFSDLLNRATSRYIGYPSETPIVTNPSGLWVTGVSSVDNTITGGQTGYTVNVTIDENTFQLIRMEGKEQRERAFIEKLRSKMKNATILVKEGNNLRRRPLSADQKSAENERKARDTLREMITESEYRRYITNGFIMVKAKSGLWYQIFNKSSGHWVFSYKDGKMHERLCIHTDALCPPTDHVINMKVLAEIDEEALRKSANITTDYRRDPLYGNIIGDLKEKNQPPKEERLVDLYKRLKTA